MFRKNLLVTRPLGVFAAVLLTWLLLPVALKTLLRVSFAEFQAPVTLGASYVRDLQTFWGQRLGGRLELMEAGRDLARHSAAQELRLQQFANLESELRRLEELLDLPIRPEYRYEVARVARRDFGVFWQQLIIRKGSYHGIPVGAPVVFSGGVVGRVREVQTLTATVDLISSRHLRLSVLLDGDTRPISYQGMGHPVWQPPRGRVDFIPADLPASPGFTGTLVTSGLGGVFPPGLFVGTLDSIDEGSDGLFRTGSVRLDERLRSIMEVAVLIPLNMEE